MAGKGGKGGRPKDSAPAKDKLDAIGIEAVCTRIAECEPLHAIADFAGVSKGTLIVWLAKFPDHYARAKEMQADKFAEDILAIADESAGDITPTENGETVNHEAIARSRLRVDARKWLASKFAPKKYGDKLAVGGSEDMPPIQTEANVTLSADEAYLRMIGK